MEINNELFYVGIRKEDKSIWERRVALVPNDVQEIMEKNKNIKFIIQNSDSRIFSDIEYQRAGAIIQQDLTKCKLILGIKEVPINSYLPNKTYMNFAHVIKAQDYNMSTLDHMLKNNIRHIDYEKITDQNGNRLIAFGKFAGIAGAIDMLRGLGLFILKMGISTSFINIYPSYKYFTLDAAYQHIKKNGKKLVEDQIPLSLCPLIFAITGRGRCADGCYEVLKNLPHKIVTPDDLQQLCQNPSDPSHRTTIYICFIETVHMAQHMGGKSFCKQDYKRFPQNYEPIFHKKYLPYISAIFHNMYWDHKFPRLITNNQIRDLVINNQSRLLGIGDVTCDYQGSIEFLSHFTHPDKPYWVYNPVKNEVIHDVVYPEKGCILYDSLDYLPCELAYDASFFFNLILQGVYFSKILKQWIPNILYSDTSKPLKEQGLVSPIQNAVITFQNKLTENFAYIQILRQEKIRNSTKNKTEIPKQPKKKNVTLLKFQGNLFGKGTINKILDACQNDKHKNDFQVIQMQANTEAELMRTFVILALYSDNHDFLDEQVDNLMQISQQDNIQVEDLLALNQNLPKL